MSIPRKLLTGFSSICALVSFSACGGGGDSGVEPPVATTITASSSTTLSGVAGAAVAENPSVLVRDQRGSPMAGVPVGFTVSAGGGTVAQGSATTSSAGIATVAGWILGTVVGPNALVASTGSLTPITFTANAVAGAAAMVTMSGDAQSAVAGSAVAVPPSLNVKDAYGNAVSGTSVTFAVVSGGGSISGGAQTTNSAGIATVGSWTLGTTAGTNRLSASAASLAAVFTATGVAGPATSVTRNGGDNQSASAGTQVPIRPSVLVRDGNGNPVSGATVVFAVGAGGGTLTGGTQVTNINGTAAVGSWTLGPGAGLNTLLAAVGSLTPVTFTATAIGSEACTVATSYAFGTTANGELTTSDCRLSDGSYIDFFTTSTPTEGGFLFQQTSSGFDTFLILYAADGPPIGVNDDDGSIALSTIKALLPAGNFVLGATSFAPGMTGSYSISSSQTSTSINTCEDVFIVKGVTTNQVLQTTDCFNTSYYSDDVWIFLTAGQAITVSMNSTNFDAHLELYAASGVVARNDNREAGTTDARVTYQATTSGFYLIVPSTAIGGATGAYTLIIQ